MDRSTWRSLLLLALPCCALLAGCRSPRLAPSPAEAPLETPASATRIGEEWIAASAPQPWLAAPSPDDDAEPSTTPPPGDTMLGGGLVVPSPASRGIGGTRLRASVVYLAPDTVTAGLYYAIGSRWTVGIIGQRLVQEREVDVNGQLIDPGDLNSFIPGFSIREKTTSISLGPLVQYRLFDEGRTRPEVSLGGYALEWGTVTATDTDYSMPDLIVRKEEDAASTGEDADKFRTVYVAASKQLPLFRYSRILLGTRAYGGAGYAARTGKRYTVAATGAGDPRVRVRRSDVTRHSFVGWLGLEAALPKSFSLYGEVFTGDECEGGYAAGLRWTSPIGITFTLGLSNCFAAVPQRALDLIYLPGGVGGQPSLVSTGGGLSSGGFGYPSSFDDDPRRRRRRRR